MADAVTISAEEQITDLKVVAASARVRLSSKKPVTFQKKLGKLFHSALFLVIAVKMALIGLALGGVYVFSHWKP